MAQSAYPGSGIGGGGGGGFVLPPEVTLKGNMFNNANELLNLDVNALAAPSNLPTLDLIRMPAANLSLAGLNIVNLANPVLGTDAATKAYVDANASGQQIKAAVAFATTGNITLSGNQTVDGQATGTSRGLVKNQTTSSDNGIYVAAAGAWVRATDADSGPELVNANVFVSAGTVNGSTSWGQITPSPITIGSSPIVWTQTGASSTALAGNGLNKVGNTFNALGTASRISVSTTIDIDPAYVGQASITTLGTVTTGTWNANVIGINKGGTAATTANNALNNLLPSQGGNAGKLLGTDGANASWQLSPTATYINVKSPPFNATGDGTTNDYTAISSAITAAGTAGHAVYFPSGTYLIGTRITLSSKVTFLGDGKNNSFIKSNGSFTGGVIYIPVAASGTQLRDIAVDGNHTAYTSSVVPTNAITVDSADNIILERIGARNCVQGVSLSSASRVKILDSHIHDTEEQCIWTNGTSSPPCREITVKNCKLENFGYDGIDANGENILIDGNTIVANTSTGAGVFSATSGLIKNIKYVNNIISRCRTGMDIGSNDYLHYGRGMLISNNQVSENYIFGIATAANGSVVSGNQANDNGIVSGSNRQTCDTGVCPYTASPGSGYAQWDIIKLTGGTLTGGGQPATFRVLAVQGGAISANTDLALIYPGDYSAWPSQDVNHTYATTAVTGVGTGARVVFTNVMLTSGGTGYKVGDVLDYSTSVRYPVFLRVTAVSGGVITGFEILSGGGFASTANSPFTLNMNGGSGSGATFSASLGPRWGNVPDQGWGITIIGATPFHTAFCSVTGNTVANTTSFMPQDGGIILGVTSGSTNKPVDNTITGNTITNVPNTIAGWVAGVYNSTDPTAGGNKTSNNFGFP